MEAALSCFQNVYRSYEALPAQLLKQIDDFENKEAEFGATRSDIATPLKNGISWVFERARSRQPKFFSVVTERAKELLVGEQIYESTPGVYLKSYNLLLDIEARCVEIHCYFKNDTFELGNPVFGNLSALPEAISHAYYWRVAGLDIPGTMPSSPMVQRQLMSNAGGNWLHFNDLWDSLFARRYGSQPDSELNDVLIGWFPELRSVSRPCSVLLTFLDTRPVGSKNFSGDQLFVNQSQKDGQVYHLHDRGMKELRILDAPVEAIDSYMEHTLLKRPTRFDFRKFGKPYRPGESVV